MRTLGLEAFLKSTVWPLALVLAAAAACVPGDEREPAERPPVSPCLSTGMLARVDELLRGETFESHYLIIRGQRVLSVWLVVPSLDPRASGAAFEEGRLSAFLAGARLGHRLISAVPCARALCDAFNPMIVDASFNCWYRDIIPLANLPPGKTPSDDELIRAVQARDMTYAYRRNLPPHSDRTDAVPSLPEWREFRRSLQTLVSPGEARRNAAVYPMFVNDYCIVQATWQADGPVDLEDAAVAPRMLEIARRFSGFALKTGRLDLTIVDARGRLRVYGKVDGYMLSPPHTISADNIIYYRLP